MGRVKSSFSCPTEYYLKAVAAGMIRVTKEDGKTNLADVLTKPLVQATKDFFCDQFMY